MMSGEVFDPNSPADPLAAIQGAINAYPEADAAAREGLFYQVAGLATQGWQELAGLEEVVSSYEADAETAQGEAAALQERVDELAAANERLAAQLAAEKQISHTASEALAATKAQYGILLEAYDQAEGDLLSHECSPATLRETGTADRVGTLADGRTGVWAEKPPEGFGVGVGKATGGAFVIFLTEAKEDPS